MEAQNEAMLTGEIARILNAVDDITPSDYFKKKNLQAKN